MTDDLQQHISSPRGSRLRRSATTLLQGGDVMLCALLRPFNDTFPKLAHAHDRLIMQHRMRRALGYEPNLRRPSTYNEKIGWRILYDQNPRIRETTDKVAVRRYVAEKGLSDLLIPLIGIYDRAADIDWDALPDSFVIKASHGCEMNIIVRDKHTADRGAMLREARRWLRHDYYESSREWAYRGIPRRIIVEQLMLDERGRIPADFKFLVFHGRTAMIRVHLDRFTSHHVNFYDRNMTLLPVRQRFATDPLYTPPRDAIAEMALTAEKLAEDFDYARIDLYLVGGKTWFGEITHHDGNAQAWFHPPSFDHTLGNLWSLPAVRANSH